MDGFIKVSSLEQLEPDSDLLSAKIVGLGETAHGSSQLHRLAGKIATGLIKISSKPVLVLLEAPNSTLKVAANKIANGHLLSIEDLNETYGVWKTAGMVDALNQFALENRKEPGKVVLKGFDIRQPLDEFKILANTLKTNSILNDFSNIEFIKNVERGILAFQSNSPAKSSLSSLKKSLAEINTKKLDDVSLGALSKIHQWVETYSQPTMKSVFAQRDKEMYQAIKENLPVDNQIIVWAHLGHLMYDSRNSDSKIDFLNEIDVLGTLLKRNLSFSYKLVAIVARELECKNTKGLDCKLTAQSGTIEESVNLNSLYKVLPEAFSPTKPVILARTNGTPDDKEMYPELLLKKAQFDYLAIDR